MTAVRPLLPGDPVRLGGYELLGRLGEGGQSIVYLGRGGDGGSAAVKLLRAQLSRNPEWRARFARELGVLGRVAGFCTAQVLDADVEGDPPYVVSEYVPGPSLTGLVTGSGPRAGTDLDRLAIGTVTALAAVHRAGILHRDFKPSNVLMGPDGPRVIDFGIARVMGAAAARGSGVVGTPSYMAPEQINDGELGTQVDLFAWGATMLFAATGRHPFGDDTISAVFHRILYLDPDLSPLPEPLREIVGACLAKDPARRPDAQQALLDLLGRHVPPAVPRQAPGGRPDDVLDDALDTGAFLATEHHPPSPPPASAPRTGPPRRSRRRRRLIVPAVLVLMLTGSGAAWALMADGAGDRTGTGDGTADAAFAADTPAPPRAAVTAAATASETLKTVLTFDHDRIDQNVAAAHARVTSGYRAAYDRRLEAGGWRTRLRETRSTIGLEVADTAVVAAVPGRVTVLAYAEQTVWSPGERPFRKRLPLRATMVRQGSDWLLDTLYVLLGDATPAGDGMGRGGWPGAGARAVLATEARDRAAASGTVVESALRPGDRDGELRGLLAVAACKPGTCRSADEVSVHRLVLKPEGGGWRIDRSQKL